MFFFLSVFRFGVWNLFVHRFCLDGPERIGFMGIHKSVENFLEENLDPKPSSQLKKREEKTELAFWISGVFRG